jgi:hypothetical protein
MKKFMAIYLAPAAAIEQAMKATPEQMKAGMDEWTKWSKTNEKAIVDLGTPLGRTKRVTSSGASESKNDMTGYSIVQGDTVDSVTKMFKDHPHFKIGAGASIDVMELVAIPGM